MGCRQKAANAVEAPAVAPPEPVQRGAFYANDFSRTPTAAAMTELGRAMFFDPMLSASGKLACAGCHDPGAAFGPANAAAVRVGGAHPLQSGIRAVPSLRYVQNVPPFSEHHFDESIDESVDQGPTGGHTWDGRADSVHDQARLPLLSAQEMANASPAAVVAQVKSVAYADALRKAFGDDVFDDNARGFKAIIMALEVFQQSPKDFYPYDSKYDAWLRGQTRLTAAESRGLAAFNDPARGNCASCHPSQIRNGSFPQFTDFGFIALGVPRNGSIPINHDGAFFDLGLCGPERHDLTRHTDFCGRFRAPTLRNVARRHSFFHNGVYHDLKRVVEFYARRDTDPQEFYPRNSDGTVRKYDDLPVAYQGNVSTEAPFGGAPGEKPRLSARDIADIVTFLGTLNDADTPAANGGTASATRQR